MREFVITHVAAHISKTVSTDDDSGMQNHAVTDRHAVFNENIWMDNAIRPDGDVVADFRAGANLGMVADYRTLADAYERADKNVFADLCIVGNYGR